MRALEEGLAAWRVVWRGDGGGVGDDVGDGWR